MKKLHFVLAMVIATALCFSGVAMADVISGTVAVADASAKSIELTKADTQENVTVWINDETTFEGAEGLDALKAGDQVEVDVKADPTDAAKWWANSVKITTATA